MPVLGLPYVLTLAALVLLTIPLCAIAERRAWRLKSARLHRQAAASPLPIDDGPLDPPYDFGGELLSPVRERVS